MASQPIVFDKNKLDISNPNVTLTASQAQAYADSVRNRSNANAWITTDSVDADNTTFEADFGEQRTLTDLILIRHNFKAFTIEYWNSGWVAFATPIVETVNSSDVSHYNFPEITTERIRITITGTMVANSDKFLYQLIATTRIGQFKNWPVISGVELDRNRVKTQALSGKYSIIENVGGFQCTFRVNFWRTQSDLDIVETLFDATEGFLIWLCGGDQAQFFAARKGYRLEDIFLMKCENEYSPNYVKGVYTNGLDLSLKLVEVVD